MREDGSGVASLRRKRRKHPSLLRTPNGVEEVIPGLSTWTVEDLLEAGAWDQELAEFEGVDLEEERPEEDPDR